MGLTKNVQSKTNPVFTQKTPTNVTVAIISIDTTGGFRAIIYPVNVAATKKTNIRVKNV